MRRVALLLLALLAAVPAACGGDDPRPTAPGSADNPLVAKTPPQPGEPSGTTAPGYKALVEKQSSAPGTRFTPCSLVTAGQARAIFGAPVRRPFEAAQGPTCIYRTQKGRGFVTLAVQSGDFNRIRRQIQQPRRIDVLDRDAYCGTHGQPMLYAPLSGDRVLSIAARCGVARRFAAKAMHQLAGS